MASITDAPVSGLAPPPQTQAAGDVARSRRAPAVPIVLVVAAGILADHAWGLDVQYWLSAGTVSLVVWGWAFRRGWTRAAAVWLLLTVAASAAAWHHWRWSIVEADHISRFASEFGQPAQLEGRLVDQPTVIPRRESEFPQPVPQFDRTVCILECRRLLSAAGGESVSGRVRLEVDGHLTGVGIDDEVSVVGLLSRPAGPRNPGAFDFRRFLRAEGLLATLRCGEPEDVRRLAGGTAFWKRWQGQLRARAERLLDRSLSPRTAPVGAALLLGTRTAIPTELRTAFAESGTMHILAISGSNVGILAGLLWTVARLAGVGRAASVGFILTGVLAYSCLADSQPPVMRAVLMVVALLAGRPWHRDGTLVNGLALAALGVLIWNPAHLFDVGAQLSFLAVAALIWAPTWSPTVQQIAGQQIEVQQLAVPAPDPLADLEHPWLSRGWRWLRRQLVLIHVTMAAIWLFTLPLTMSRFHLVSPVGFVVNLILAPLVVVILWSGYALLLVGLLAPFLATPLAWLFDAGLRVMLGLIEYAASVPGGHLYLPGPSDGWLLGFYLCLAAVAAGWPGGPVRWWGWRSLLVWTVGGLAIALWPQHPGVLRCTFLSMGHGLAVVVDLPGGETLVYDAGQMQDPARARQAVLGALWDRGSRSVTALVISHADVDHFNGVPGLAETIPIGSVLVHETFLDFQQPGVEQVCDLLAQRRVPIRLIQAGDQLALDPAVRIAVLHPPAHDRLPTDNANSVVLSLEYAGRRIVLTGDLERDGLEYVLMQPNHHADVLLAPHHGRVNANPRRLADWATPDYVIVSDGRQDSSDRLAEVYGPVTQILSTRKSGAITFVIRRDGDLSCETIVTDDGPSPRGSP